MKRKQLELQTELAKAQAEELAYAKAESSQVGSYRALSQIANSRTHLTVQMSSPLQATPYGQKTGNRLRNIQVGLPSLNAEAKSHTSKVEKDDDRKVVGPLHLSVVKEATSKCKSAEPLVIDSLARSLVSDSKKVL